MNHLEILEVGLPAPTAVDGGGALVCGQEGVQGLAQCQEAVMESPHSCREEKSWLLRGKFGSNAYS